jgi:Domain of unknown function (DUF1772)
MQCGVELAATEFAPSYRRATIMQATCAAVGLLSSLAAWLTGATFWWLVAGVLLGSVIPFTLIVILPTNPGIGSAVRRSGASACTLGEAPRCAERPKRAGAGPFPVLGDLWKGYLSPYRSS